MNSVFSKSLRVNSGQLIFKEKAMKIKSWIKRIWDKWFPEIKQGITSQDDKGKAVSKQKRYPVCRGAYLPSKIPIRRKAIN